jgi:hypothetical protein
MARISLAIALTLAAAGRAACAGMRMPGDTGMSFFVTSANPGQGADFGGLAGADRYCEALAAGVGQGRKNWRAYLSTTGADSVNARDRIGRGPWYNARGVQVAASVDELHGANQLRKETALTEKGETVAGRGDPVNDHDILTGSASDGRAVPGAGDTTCGNWTQGGEGSAIVGHHDRMGLRDDEPSRSWNSSHPTRGCGLQALRSTGGAGLLYCFAAN